MVQDSRINATACPAGRIYITSGLFKSLESEKELEGVLAHEISHVERRHGFRQYRAAYKGQVASLLFGVLAGVAAKAATDDAFLASTVADVFHSLSLLSSQIVIAGHSREFESEADLLTCAYFAREGDQEGRKAYGRYLKKLLYLEELNGESRTSPLASHPHIWDRVGYVQDGNIEVFPDSLRATLRKDGEEIGVLTVDGQIFYNQKFIMLADAYKDDGTRLKLFSRVETNDLLEKPIVIKSIELENADGLKWKLHNELFDDIYPDDNTGIVFECKNKVGPIVLPIISITVDIE